MTREEHGERIAALEVKVDGVREDMGEMREALSCQRKATAQIAEDVRAMRETLANQRGWIAGVAATVSAVWVLAMAGWQFLSGRGS